MQIKIKHSTRKAAAAYLEARGWIRAGSSLGDWVFRHPQLCYRNVLVQLNNRKWKIQSWGLVA